jgi:hypothetical protein
VEFRRKIMSGTFVCLLVLFAALTWAGCGDSSSVTTTTSALSTTSAPTTTVADEKQAAEAYLIAITPILDKDYQGVQWLEQASAQWEETYGNSDLSTNRQAWDALGLLFQQALVKEQEIIQGYEAVTPPEAFANAHAALLQINREGALWAESVVAAIKANAPADELMSMLTTEPSGLTDSEMLAEFQEVASRVGVELPVIMFKVYSDEADLGTV